MLDLDQNKTEVRLGGVGFNMLQHSESEMGVLNSMAYKLSGGNNLKGKALKV